MTVIGIAVFSGAYLAIKKNTRVVLSAMPTKVILPTGSECL